MKTQWNSKRFFGTDQKELTEREKEIELNDSAEDGEELIYCASGVTDGQVRYNENSGVLSFYASSHNGDMGGWLTTDDFTDETLVNIINALCSILDKRKEEPKMVKCFKKLETYMPWAVEFILMADKLNIWGRKELIIEELCNAYEDGKIDQFEGASAIHIINATYGLREAMFKNE